MVVFQVMKPQEAYSGTAVQDEGSILMADFDARGVSSESDGFAAGGRNRSPAPPESDGGCGGSFFQDS